MKKVKCNLIWKFPAKIRIFASLQDKYFIYAEHVKDSHDFCVFSMDVQGCYDPRDSAGFIRVSSLR